MTGSTPILGLTYPLGTDRLMDGDDVMRTFLGQLDTIVGGSKAAITAGPNITLGSSEVYRRAKIGLLLFENLVTTVGIGSALLCTLPAGYRPPVLWRGFVNNFTTGTGVLIQISPDGTVLNGQAMAAGNALYGSTIFPLA